MTRPNADRPRGPGAGEAGAVARAQEHAAELGRTGSAGNPSRRLERSELLAAVLGAGSSHIYADTADHEELEATIATGGDAILREVDGNTVNQPLVHKVVERYLEGDRPESWARELWDREGALTEDLVPALYTVLCCRIGNDIVQKFAAGREWEVSLQLHMQLSDDPEAARRTGETIRRSVPSGIVKVPFTPHAPHCFLVARDLEQQGIPVNFTSTFSARQAVMAALLSNVTRTNIFMGRLAQGLEADYLGEHVVLEGQRALIKLRRDSDIKTLLIVASMREWESFPRLAGCDVFTAPCKVLSAYLERPQSEAADVTSQLDTSYEDRIEIGEKVLAKLPRERIARLWQVEPELVEFLSELRVTAEYRNLSDGDKLYKRFDDAGFADAFYAPSESEWSDIRRGKLPDLESPLTGRLALDTLYTLLAHGDFVNHQDEIDSLLIDAKTRAGA